MSRMGEAEAGEAGGRQQVWLQGLLPIRAQPRDTALVTAERVVLF